MKVVLSGSGMLYPIHVGAIKKLREEHEIKEICGTSGGAMVASLVASGAYHLEEMVLDNMPSENDIFDPSILLPVNLGVIKGKKIKEIFEDMFVSSFDDTYIPLKVITCNLNEMSHEVFGTQETPEFDVATSVRASISIPGIFSPVKIDGDYHVDGGVVANYPIDIYGSGKDVVGIRLQPSIYKRREINGVKDYAMALIGTVLDSMAQERIDNVIRNRCIEIPTTFSGTKFMMTKDEARQLIDHGYKRAEHFLKTNEVIDD